MTPDRSYFPETLRETPPLKREDAFSQAYDHGQLRDGVAVVVLLQACE